MGDTFTQIVVRGPSQASILELLSNSQLHATVGPTIGSYTVLSDQSCLPFNEGALKDLCIAISSSLDAVCLGTMFYDDDILWYQLFARGSLVDQYCSSPGYLSGERTGPECGDVDKLGAALGLSAAQKALAAEALHKDLGPLRETFRKTTESLRVLYRDPYANAQRIREEGRRFIERETTRGDVFESVFEARWRLRRLFAGIGAPDYAIDFRFGSTDAQLRLPTGSVVNTGA